jgi:lipid A ethanolaminephosphotransferase
MASVQPLAPITGAVRYVRLLAKSTKIELQVTGPDARPGSYLSTADKPVLMVIVAGETSRAQNWSLGGYDRDTNPELAKRDVVYFPHVTSCGTATAISLPCMFSPLTRSDYSFDRGLAHENLLDVLQRAGFDVLWLDNNTGDKHIADRASSRMMKAEDDPASCVEECIDAVFLPDLREMAETITKNTVVVLHTIGSHGPSYWLRYPPEEEAFKPACQSPEFSSCSQAEIANAYDNTIRYTDHFLSQVIDILDETDRVIPAMFYVSDHGESLGEGGLYLHGAPYFMAPEYQTRVPMVLWTPDRFAQVMGVDKACMSDQSKLDLSHDNMFSTMLGLLDVTTEARDASLDFASTCRKSAGL